MTAPAATRHALLALTPSETLSEGEARLLAPTPAVSQTVAEWRALPRALDREREGTVLKNAPGR